MWGILDDEMSKARKLHCTI